MLTLYCLKPETRHQFRLFPKELKSSAPNELRTDGLSIALQFFACDTILAVPPNVVFILADDLGWSDTTLYGTTKFYRTPNISRLAERGMTFTRAYSASPLCSPTRASILTGLSPARHGITSPSCHLPKVVLSASPQPSASPARKSTTVNSVTRLNTDYITLAESLKEAGYATGHFGKWHLGAEPYSPLQHGFDVDVPHWPGPGPAGSYVAPWKFPDFDHDPRVPDQHIEDRMAIEAVSFLESHHDQPFFLNYWMFSVHAPFDAKHELIEQYRGRVDPMDPQRCPTYAAMIESMDDAVGSLLDTLDRLKIADRTIIVFASDNGGNMYNEVEGETPTSNAPLRGGKATMYEGGVRGPAIVVWPEVVEPNSRSEEVIQSCDYYPTILEMIGIEPAEDQLFDGTSIVPALKQRSIQREAIFTYFPHNPRVPDWLPPAVSVHHGDWKLIRLFHGGDNGKHAWKLFNLADDLGERNDLAAEQPDRVARLDSMIEDFLDRTEAVRPIPNPSFDASQHRPELIGKPQAKRSRSASTTQVAGWSGQNCKLSVAGKTLRVQCLRNDPHLSRRLPVPIQGTKLVVELTMAAKGSGAGQFFWSEAGAAKSFHRERRIDFSVVHDGKARTYRVALSPQHPVTGIRIDPGGGKGLVEIASLKVLDEGERERFVWMP